MLAYFDCFAGIAGDMTVAAFLDLGLDEALLRSRIASLGITPPKLSIGRSKRLGIAGVTFDVEATGPQPHRHYEDIKSIIGNAGLPAQPERIALTILDYLAEAEAQVHGVPVDQVHFHEVGAVDSIVDVIAVATGIEALQIERVISSPLPLGRGFIDSAHGRIPNPAPATVALLRGVPVYGIETSMELVTPTGAAIVRCLADDYGHVPACKPLRIGYGLGNANPKEFPNALRVILAEEQDLHMKRDRVAVLRSQVDDLDPRILGHVMDALLARGVLDVTFSAVQMKKNRPGVLITVIVPPRLVDDTTHFLLTNTTTLGVRVSYEDRTVLNRSPATRDSSFGPLQVKIVDACDGGQEIRPEFAEVLRLARQTGLSPRRILQVLEREFKSP